MGDMIPFFYPSLCLGPDASTSYSTHPKETDCLVVTLDVIAA